jgi:hypothetical protein
MSGSSDHASAASAEIIVLVMPMPVGSATVAVSSDMLQCASRLCSASSCTPRRPVMRTPSVVAVMRLTFDGSDEPVAEMATGLDRLQERTGWDIP